MKFWACSCAILRSAGTFPPTAKHLKAWFHSHLNCLGCQLWTFQNILPMLLLNCQFPYKHCDGQVFSSWWRRKGDKGVWSRWWPLYLNGVYDEVQCTGHADMLPLFGYAFSGRSRSFESRLMLGFRSLYTLPATSTMSPGTSCAAEIVVRRPSLKTLASSAYRKVRVLKIKSDFVQ